MPASGRLARYQTLCSRPKCARKWTSGAFVKIELPMSSEIKKEIQLEIAHVLFIDIVGYSKLSINEQSTAVDELNAPDDLDTLMNKTAFVGLHRPDPATNGPTGLAGAQHRPAIPDEKK